MIIPRGTGELHLVFMEQNSAYDEGREDSMNLPKYLANEALEVRQRRSVGKVGKSVRANDAIKLGSCFMEDLRMQDHRQHE